MDDMESKPLMDMMEMMGDDMAEGAAAGGAAAGAAVSDKKKKKDKEEEDDEQYMTICDCCGCCENCGCRVRTYQCCCCQMPICWIVTLCLIPVILLLIIFI